MQKVATAPNVFNREHSLINGIKVSECLIVVCRFDRALVLECNRIKCDIAPFTDFMLAFVPRNLIHGRETEGKPSGLARDDGHLHCRGQFAGAGRARGVRFFSLARFGANAPSWGGAGWSPSGKADRLPGLWAETAGGLVTSAMGGRRRRGTGTMPSLSGRVLIAVANAPSWGGAG